MDLLILGLTCITNLTLGSIVVLQNSRGGMQRSFGLMTAAICLWIIANYLANNPFGNSVAVADISNRLAYLFAGLLVFSGVLFTYYFPARRRPRKAEAAIVTLSGVLLCGLSLTTYVSGVVSRDAFGNLAFSIGSGLWLYIVVFLAAVGYAACNLLVAPGARSKRTKRQARFVLFAFAASALTGLVLNVILPVVVSTWHTTRFGPLATIILVSAISYQIARRGLFDIRLATVRTVSYAASLLTLSVVYYFVAYLISATVLGGHLARVVDTNPVTVILVLAFVLAFLFRPVKRFFDTVTDDIFYHDRYQVEDFFARFGELLASAADLRALLERAAAELAATFKAEQAFFLLYHADEVIARHLSAGTSGHTALTAHNVALLDHYAADDGRSPLIVRELLTDNHGALRRMLRRHRLAVVMTLRHEGAVFGYVALGDRLSGTYTKRDLDTLVGTSNELVIAIQNAFSLRRVTDLNETLEQRIDAATKELRRSNAKLKHLDEVKDEFMSMASHQLRTPLAGVKGNLSMVLEGDMGPLLPQQERVLQDAFTSSDRMAGLVADFLNVSRIQTGKFMIEKTSFDLRTVAEQEVDRLRQMAATHHMKLQLNVEGDDFIVIADESKLRQVIMNFIDNAIYYSHPDTTVKINLVRTKEAIDLTVVDNGIGVPKAEQARLFKKFFRAKNARAQRPDGTGVGLFLAQKVVAAHHGTLIFSSKEGQGSTFGFSLPCGTPASAARSR
ncbi:sensor histidine kinase [Mycobacterium sp. Aquia_213]|uniref:sensor histidine kinase n=1 Tax=Mycobacterium sp. Aquia_213 TaxID=2991728 RepID=UPI002270B030|nr:sensor histidine kinase [Mycobacterium sp. Aquia_213]WAC90215.1 ATP-binding protein [Mycobacterium sp. Aquia_213]